MGFKWKALVSLSMLSEAGEEAGWMNLEENSLNVNLNFGQMERWILHVQTRPGPDLLVRVRRVPTALSSAFSIVWGFFSGHAALLWFCWHLLASSVNCKYTLGFFFVYLDFSFALILTFVHVSSCSYTDRRDDLPPAVRSLKPLLFFTSSLWN